MRQAHVMTSHAIPMVTSVQNVVLTGCRAGRGRATDVEQTTVSRCRIVIAFDRIEIVTKNALSLAQKD